MLIQNEVDGLVNALTKERERYWMTPDMTKTGAAPGHWGSPPLADTLLRYHVYYFCDSIWVHPSILGVLFCGVGVVAAMPHMSPDQATTSILVGIASCTLSYWLSYSRPLQFWFVPLVYGLPSGDFRFWGNYGLVYALGNINCVKGGMGHGLTLF